MTGHETDHRRPVRRLPEGVVEALVALNSGAHTALEVSQKLDITPEEAQARMYVLVDYGLIERSDE